MYLFWTNWKKGQSFKQAVDNSYNTTINIMDGIIKSIPVLGGYLSTKLDVKNLDFVKASEPVIKGQSGLTINSPR
jgi:hypothetical protein